MYASSSRVESHGFGGLIRSENDDGELMTGTASKWELRQSNSARFTAYCEEGAEDSIPRWDRHIPFFLNQMHIR